MAITAHDIYNQIHSPGDTTGLEAMGRGCGDLKSIHSEVATKLAESQAALNSFWKGQAAETGKAGLAPLIATSHIAAEKMDSMRKSIAEQSAAFNYVKNAVVPVAATRPDDQKLSDYVSIGASDDEIAAAEFDDKTKKNVEAYSQYQLSTDPRTQTMPMDYPAAHDPDVSSTGITPDQPTPGTSAEHVGSGVGHHSSGGGSSHNYGGGSTHDYSSGPSTYSAPPGAAGMPAHPPPGHGGAVTPPVSPTNDSTRVAWADPTPPPTPTPTWQPSSASSGGGSPSTGGFNGGFGPVGGFGGGFGPTGGSGSGFGPGGSGSAGAGGAGSGGAGARGVGGGTGVGALGESAGAGRPGAGGAGATGAKGQPGMGGMGGGGKGGKGPDDEEHQRKILLAEEDPDSIFGGYDGDRPTPPVIGA